MKIPAPFNKILLSNFVPATIKAARSHFGLQEFQGKRNNPEILRWAKELGVPWYTSDEIPWCGLFAAKVCFDAKKPYPAEFLRALSWAHWGKPVTPALGVALVFKRGGKSSGLGHVGFYVAETPTSYVVLGGNQNDSVNLSRKPKHTLFASRYYYERALPASMKPVMVTENNELVEARED